MKWGGDPMSGAASRADHVPMSRPSQLLDTDPALRRAPMPMNLPPVGPARAGRIRLLALREQLLGPDGRVDVDAVAERIAGRAEFTRRLTARLAAE